MGFKAITTKEHEAFLSALRAGQYNLLLGAGASMDSSNRHGQLPSGSALKNDLCSVKKVSQNHSLQRVFSLLTPQEVKDNVTSKFIDTIPGPTAQLLGGFVWKRIFSWNIDDVLENLYRAGKGRQVLNPIHFSDPFAEASNLTELLLIHLHGYVWQPEKGYVFSRTEYISQIKNISHWMTVLVQLLQTEPFVIAGTSLDEVDLDFYLSHRTPATSRLDRGPSILVEMQDDAITQDVCQKHSLLHFIGYTYDFAKYCAEVLPNRPTPYELIPLETQKLLPAGVSKAAALAFHSDFEIVPATVTSTGPYSRFTYGHPPTWSDLEENADVARSLTSGIVPEVEKRLSNPNLPRLLLVNESAGTGKTTVLRRIGFELAKRGTRVLMCSTLGRLDRSIASTIDMIDEPLVLLIDNFADQAPAIADLLSAVQKEDVVVIGAERSYRSQYLTQVLSGTEFDLAGRLPLLPVEARALLDKYVTLGFVSGDQATRNLGTFASSLVHDPIAVACCRILNDFRPLERIVDDLIKATQGRDLDRYLLAALSRHCFVGGVRYELAISAFGGGGIKEQFSGDRALPLAYADAAKAFIVPENATMADRVLSRVADSDPDRLLPVFVGLANAIAPRVNRQAIMKRSPEARLSGRLFDYDDVVVRFLGRNAESFYEQTRKAWQWNSRYWEQMALLKLAIHNTSNDPNERDVALRDAVQHAHHAVFIERHPFPLSTLGKVLMVQMLEPGVNMAEIFSDAFDRLKLAIDIETSWSRRAVHPFVFLFSGAITYLDAGGVLLARQRDSLYSLIDVTRGRFARDAEMQELTGSLLSRLR